MKLVFTFVVLLWTAPIFSQEPVKKSDSTLQKSQNINKPTLVRASEMRANQLRKPAEVQINRPAPVHKEGKID